MSRHWFPIVTLVVGSIYATTMFFYKTDIAAITSIYATIMISSFTFWLEKRESELASENQLTAILSRTAFLKIKNFVWRRKVDNIIDVIQELDGKSLSLNSEELEEYTTELLKSLSFKRSKSNKYLATHIVNNDIYLEVWGEKCPYYKSMEEFVLPQKNILNNNGEVVRIFIFTHNFLKQRHEECINMLKFHDLYYKNTKHKVTTLVYVTKSNDNISHDITIVNDEFVFEWYRNVNSEYGYSGGKCFIESEKNKFLNNFNRIKSKSFTPDKIKTMI